MGSSRNSKLAFAAIAILTVILAGALFRRPLQLGSGTSRTTTHKVIDVVQGETVKHVFVPGNEGWEDVRIWGVIPRASEVVSADCALPAGGKARIAVKLGTGNLGNAETV